MAPTIGVNLRVTGHCNQGGRKYMEDAFVVAYQQTEDEKDLEYAYFGIFDGHGGREAALYAKEHLMGYIVNQKNFWSEDDNLVLKAIRDGFITTHLAMWKEVGNWPKTMSGLPSTSGTTSSIAFIRRGKLYIGHVGDSKIVLGYQESGIDGWNSQPLTNDHKPESPKESKRIYSAGGLVMTKAGVKRVVWNRPRVGHKGPIRRSTPFDQIPFLAVARSLGDLWSYNYSKGEFVVSPEPDVSVFTLDPKRDRCIILASDGLWNMVSPRDAIHLVQKAEEKNEKLILEGVCGGGVSKPSYNPSKLLVDRALLHWFEFGMRADNTSVVTVLLDPPGPPKNEVLLRQKIMQKLRPRDEQGEMEALLQNQSEGEAGENKTTKKIICEVPPCKAVLEELKNRVSSSSEVRAFNLPKPVVLSPRRVLVKPLGLQESKNMCNAVADPVKEVIAESSTDLVHSPAEVTSTDVPVNVSADSCTSQPEDEPDSNSEGQVSSTMSAIAPPPNENIIENDPSKVPSPEREAVCHSSKNPRTHLSEVENIVKYENADGKADRLRLQLNAQETENKTDDNRVSSSSHLKRKSLTVADNAVSPKAPKLGSSSWRRDTVVTSCQVIVARETAHNTRSQQRNRKVKVR